MTGNGYICGWYGANLYADGALPILNTMLNCFKSQNKASIVENKKIKFAVSGDTHRIKDKVNVAIFGLPYWKDDKLSQFADEHGHAAAVADIYLKKGVGFLSLLAGRFVVTIYDEANDKVILVIDRIGQHHCYYSLNDGDLVFASRADAVISHPKITGEISTQGIFNYIYYHAIPSPSSIYQGLNKLTNGEYLVFQNGQLHRAQYWRPEFLEKNHHLVDDLSEEMLEIIERSVLRNSKNASVGAFLSGGLDSSTVSGMLSKISNTKAKTFSIGFNAKGYDEMEFARTASRHFSTEMNEYYVTPEDVVDMVPKIASFIDEPFGNSSALPAYFCARMAKSKGIERLLAGDGGDEIFAGNERYIKQGVFEAYQKIPASLRSMLIEPVLIKNAFVKKIPLIKKVSSYVRQANIALPDRLETYNFLHQHAAQEIFSTEFLIDIDVNQPLELLRDTYHAVDDATYINRMMWMDWKRTLHDNDLVKVNRMCELAGIEVAYPLLDDELIEFSCLLPSKLKLKNGKLRWFYKEAVKGFLPSEIINKTKQGFGLPFGVWTKEHKGLQELAYTAIESLKQRGIFNEKFLERTVEMHRGVHASYYGELIWVLMMLELWLANR